MLITEVPSFLHVFTFFLSLDSHEFRYYKWIILMLHYDQEPYLPHNKCNKLL